MWKPLLEAVEAKATRKLAIMKKLGGTTWGANSNILQRVYAGVVYLQNLGYCLKNLQKQSRQSAEHGPENILRCYEKHTSPTNGKDCRLSSFRMQMWVQSCHPRGKAEETDKSSTPWETSAWNQNHLKRKLQHKLKDPQKENADLQEADPGKCEELTVSVWTLRKSLSEVRTEILGLAAKGT